MTDAIVATDVRKRYGEVDALSGVSLAVGRGEVFALVGPNGAGKTTLVRALTGTTETDDGSVVLDGSDPRQADAETLGVLPQSFGPPGRLTATEVVAYYAGLYDDARPVADVLEDVGVTAVADTYYEDLSGGEQRRVCLGSTLVNDPEVLFLDEPTTGIDPAGRRTVWRLLDEQVASGTTVFLTTHDMREAERLADRVGLLADGELVAVGDPAALIEAHAPAPTVVATLDVDGAADPDAVATAAVEALAQAGYEASAHEEGTIHVDAVAARDVGAVADVLDDAEVGFSELAWSEPDLEDVYLAVTGDAYDDTDAGGRRAANAVGSTEGGAADGGGAS